MSVRLFHRGARLVLVVRRERPGRETWWAPHQRPHDWATLLARPLSLLGLSPRREALQSVVCALGRIEWTVGRHWSTIRVDLDRGSEKKRRLVTAALLKAARYALPAASGMRGGEDGNRQANH